MELVSEEQVIDAVRSDGPVVPMDIRRITKAGDSITIGATLSTLSARGLVLITHIKRGGSPFYYVKGQEEKIAELSKFLNEKDRRTCDALKQNKIIRDKAEEPLTRISLRNIPDFAKSMAVEINGVQEVFWRWYMLPEEEAIAMIRSSAKPVKQEKAETKLPENKQAQEIVQTKPAEIVAQKEPKEQKELSAQQELKGMKEVKVQDLSKEYKKSEDKPVRKTESKPESKETSDFLEVNEEVQQKLNASENIQIISNFNDAFISKVGAFLASGKIVTKEAKQIKKGSEYDLVIEIPTPVGNVEYFCKAKSKKKCNEGDLSSASVQGQNMRLPILFITTGEVVKKAKDKLKADFKGMIIKEI